MIELNQILHADCMDIMKDIPDKWFELAIVDPPYGIGEDGGKDRRNKSKHIKKNWDKKPNKDYFDELFRISINQVIFGANYFIENIYSSAGIFVGTKNYIILIFQTLNLSGHLLKEHPKYFNWQKMEEVGHPKH